ncbi:MAG: divalent-cation tolerance protein CutA [Chloroflexota bacterium]|nr:MAG: divalent-cation tolerance protein CutA [Chloroflexota bacterium]
MELDRLLVLITAPSKEIGEDIAKVLVEKKLAACVNLMAPVRSIYTWEGEINQDDEVLLMVKSRANLFDKELVPTVKALHPYDVPEIIAVPILMGSTDYLSWMDQETRRP